MPDVGNCGETFAGNRQSATDNSGVVSPAGAAGLSDLVPSLVTPEMVELDEIRRTQGDDAVRARCNQLVRNDRRREFRSERKRFAEIAMNINLRRAAERLAAQKLAEREAHDQLATKKPLAFVAADVNPEAESRRASRANSYGLTWIAITSYEINEMRTISG